MYAATPMNSTTGRMTRAKSVNPSPNADACATSAKATIAPVRVVRNIPARLNDSFQASERDASRLQCSVDRIWSRIAGDTPSAIAAPLGGTGAGSAPIPGARSKDIMRTSLPAGSATVPDRQEDVTLRRQVIDLPVVVAAVRVGLGLHDLGVRGHRAHIALRVVVPEQRVRHVRRSAVRLQVTSG